MSSIFLKVFEYDGSGRKVNHIETQEIKSGVTCDVYEFIDDKTCDLGIIRVSDGASTPKQKVLSGDKTIEGYVSGSGVLTVIDTKLNVTKYEFPSSVQEIVVNTGETMQWLAKTELTFYEICYPSYADGRFQNLD